MMLLLNAFKGLKKHKLQMLSIIVLIFLSTGIYTMMTTAVNRIENRYYSYLEEQNVEDFSFVLNMSYEKDFTSDEVMMYLNNELKDIDDNEKAIVYTYLSCLSNKTSICNDYLYYMVDNIFTNYNINSKKAKDTIDTLSKKYNFSYELKEEKLVIEDDTYIKILPKEDEKIDIPYLIEGSFPKNKNEITILKGFAKKNNLKIGDCYTINGKNYKIVGYSYSSSYIYPLLSMNVPIFDESKNNIVYMSIDDYNEVIGTKTSVYAAKFNDKKDPRDRMKIDLEEDKETKRLVAKTDNPANELFVNEQDKIGINIETIARAIRIDAMQEELKTTKTFALYFLYLLLSISVVIIVIITKKRIDDERLQIGVLKSLGYNRFVISCSYLVYPIVGSLVGGFLGYFVGYFCNDILANTYLSYFNIVLDDLKIDYSLLKMCVCTPCFILSILGYLVAFIMLRKKPLQLLKEGSNLKVNFVSKITNKITKHMKFDRKLKVSLLSRSVGKLIVVFITSFVTGLLIVLSLIGKDLFNNIINDTFSLYKWNYMIMYNSYMEKEDNSSSDYVFQKSAKVSKIIKKDGEEILDVNDTELSLNGVDSTLNYLKASNDKKEDLFSILTDKTIIINENVKKLFSVDIGDKLVFNINDKNYSYYIVGINNTYLDTSCYVKRSDLSKMIGYTKDIYNVKYTNDNKYSSIKNISEDEKDTISMVFSLNDLKNNIKRQMDVYNKSIYVVIIFASFMALIIICVIANIIIEENKKTISLMKVMGYSSKRISRIVLNIYTPVVCLAYFLSIPCMINLLKKIISVLSNDMKLLIPISFGFKNMMLGLFLILLAYFIAMNISRKSLNKIPLSIALKRE